MSQLLYVAPTKRSPMTKARATRIFLSRNGRCYLCGNQIRPGEPYEIEHPEELADGGSDRNEDLHPVHVKCHKAKTAAARAPRSKRNNLVTAGWQSKPRKSAPMPGSKASGLRKRMNGTVERRT